MIKHLYNKDGTLTDDGARLIHDVRNNIIKIYDLLTDFPVIEAMSLIIETVTDNNVLSIVRIQQKLKG